MVACYLCEWHENRWHDGRFVKCWARRWTRGWRWRLRERTLVGNVVFALGSEGRAGDELSIPLVSGDARDVC